MRLLRTLRFIVGHPLNKGHALSSLLRFAWWQLISRIRTGFHLKRFASRSVLWMKRGMHGATGNYYCGLLEFEDMSFVLHVLRADDHFIDIGANIGSYTILAASECNAKVTAFEPVSHTHERLQDNVKANQVESRVRVLSYALGETRSTSYISTHQDATNHLLNSAQQSIHNHTQRVQVSSLDELNIEVPICLKCDVEGYELPVLQGASNTLSNASLKAIIIEINGSGQRYGYEDSAVHNLLIDHGFRPFRYEPFSREFTALDTYGDHNTLYLRDVTFIESRVAHAPKRYIHGRTF